MKKILALFLACVIMLSGMMSTVAAETTVEDSETAEVITLLKYLKIITDADNLGDYVTRADFASYASKLIKLESGKSLQHFDDVVPTLKTADAINALAEYGYFSSGQGIMFNPYNNIRTTEALKVFLSMLGYKDICESVGGYPAGYIKIAQRIGLNKGIGSEYLTKGQLYALLYRTLVEPFCMPSVITTDGSLKIEKDADNTILLNYHELHTITGIVNTVGSISVDMQESVDEGEFRIEDTIIRTDLISNDMYECLGINVTVYYHETDTIRPTAALVIPHSDTNNVLSFKKDDLINIQDAGRTYIFKYYNENNNEKTLVIPRGSVVIKNGETVLLDVYNEMQIEKGSYKFVDTDNDGDYDVLFVYEYYNIVVGTIEDQEGMLHIRTSAISDISHWQFYRGKVGSRRAVYDKYEANNNIDLTEDGNRVVRYKDSSGKLIDLADISKDEVISVYESSNGNYIEVHKGKSPVKGEVTEYSKIDNGDETFYEILVNNNVYVIDETVVDKMSTVLAVGLKATFYLDCFGEVGAYVPDTEENVKFAYLVAVAQNVNGLSIGNTMVRMYTQDGVLGDFSCSDKIKIDGEPCKTRTDAYNALSGHEKEPVRYSLDDDDNIVFIDTTYHNEEKEGNMSISQTLEEGVEYTYNGYYGISHTEVIKSATPIFHVPSDAVIDAGTYTEDHFYLGKFNEFASGEKTSVLSAYIADQEGVFSDIIIMKSGEKPKKSSQQNVYLIDRILRVLNDDGDNVQCVYAYLNGELGKFTCTTNCEDLSTRIGKGDLVWFMTNGKGEIDSLQDIIVDVDTDGNPLFKVQTSNTEATINKGEQIYAFSSFNSNNVPTYSSTPGTGFSMIFGYAAKTKDGAICFVYDKNTALDDNGNYKPKAEYNFVKSIGSINIVVFDKGYGLDGSIYKSGIDDIITVQNSVESCSKVLILMRNYSIKSVYVYK